MTADAAASGDFSGPVAARQLAAVVARAGVRKTGGPMALGRRAAAVLLMVPSAVTAASRGGLVEVVPVEYHRCAARRDGGRGGQEKLNDLGAKPTI
jgi:hypothetical protein